jgi:hypothetical protein
MIIGIFSHFFAVETTLAECQFFRALAKLIGRRAARLSACGIAAIVSKMGYLDDGCAVGADGSLYNASPCPVIRLRGCKCWLISAFCFCLSIASGRLGHDSSDEECSTISNLHAILVSKLNRHLNPQ